ncbi:hypothetical protein PAPYR_7904 [Paratrimastix pyriformis]|uniref:Uncharacterized protein n=1 Tax=Paratrimastix pyriformis TaxID=342808 RepID=A0ABQ8UBX3_9EUKA|nr:hypothetical protein PAPYR_7904 [Paratrimastix pyriformis]
MSQRSVIFATPLAPRPVTIDGRTLDTDSKGLSSVTIPAEADRCTFNVAVGQTTLRRECRVRKVPFDKLALVDFSENADFTVTMPSIQATFRAILSANSHISVPWVCLTVQAHIPQLPRGTVTECLITAPTEQPLCARMNPLEGSFYRCTVVIQGNALPEGLSVKVQAHIPALAGPAAASTPVAPTDPMALTFAPAADNQVFPLLISRAFDIPQVWQAPPPPAAEPKKKTSRKEKRQVASVVRHDKYVVALLNLVRNDVIPEIASLPEVASLPRRFGDGNRD